MNGRLHMMLSYDNSLGKCEHIIGEYLGQWIHLVGSGIMAG